MEIGIAPFCIAVINRVYVLDKVIIDIEDMNDISEAESQRLIDFCNCVVALEDLFTPEILPSELAHGEAPISLTAVYTPSWIKFQYLTNILESSLVDIKYLWTEGELKLEYRTEDLVHLTEALLQIRNIGERLLGKLRCSVSRYIGRFIFRTLVRPMLVSTNAISL